MGCPLYGGCGVVFKVSRSGGEWTENVLYAFEQGGGRTPYSGVTFDSAGNLYGTLLYGGAYDGGTVYEVTHSESDRTETTLHSLGAGADGGNPFGGWRSISMATSMALRMMAGVGNGGTIYQLQPSGGNWTYNTLPILQNLANFAGTLLTVPACDWMTSSNAVCHYGTEPGRKA